MLYAVTNQYGISGETYHHTVVAALHAASKREGDGWIVVDEDGDRWDFDFEMVPQVAN